MIAGHETRSAGAHAIDPQCFNGGGLNYWVMGQIEVIVARERQQPAAVAEQPNPRHAGGVDERAA
jgi:hypothetical protein